jgi:hypothetical protein
MSQSEVLFKDIRTIATELSISASKVCNESKVIQLYYDLHHIYKNTSDDEIVLLSRMKTWFHKYNMQLNAVPASMLADPGKLDTLSRYVQFYAYPDRNAFSTVR